MPKMQTALTARISDECHLFGDILDIFQVGSARAKQLILEGCSYEGKLRAAETLQVHGQAWCHQHGHMCPLRTDTACRVGGFPCQDFSQAGLQQSTEGKNMPAILAFGQKAKHTASPVLCVENVENCPADLMIDVFGDVYDWTTQRIFTPADVGFPCVSRRRLPYTSCVIACKTFLLPVAMDVNPPMPWRRLYMGAVHMETTDCVFNPSMLLDHVFHCIKRDPPKLRMGRA